MPSDNTWIFYLFTHSLLCSCSCLNHSTYIAVFTSSSAPHCSVLSSQAFPIPSPLNHFKAFLSAPFNMKSPWATISVVEEGWICAGLLTPSHTCSCFEQHQVGHWDDWQQAQNRNVKLKYWSGTGDNGTAWLDRDLQPLCTQNWTESMSLTQTYTLQKKSPNKRKGQTLKRPSFGLVVLICCFSPKQEYI